MKGRQWRPSHQRLLPPEFLCCHALSSYCWTRKLKLWTGSQKLSHVPRIRVLWCPRRSTEGDLPVTCPAGTRFSIPTLGGMSLFPVPWLSCWNTCPDCGTGPPLHDGPQHLPVSPWRRCFSSSWGDRGSSPSRGITVRMPSFLSVIFAIRISQGCWVHKTPAGWRSMLWSHTRESRRLLHTPSHWW